MFHINWPWKKKEDQWKRWLSLQLESLNRGEEIVPPWIAYPESDPWWGGWRQGNSEGWLVLVWLPFWHNITDEARVNYIEKWNASADWREYLGDSPTSNEPLSIAEHVLNFGIFGTKK